MCGDIVTRDVRPGRLKKKPPRFCSQKCHSITTRDRVTVNCAYCGVEFGKTKSRASRTKSGLHFCSREHKDAAQRFDSGIDISPPNYKGGASNYRARALRDYGERCEKCGYDECPAILEAHHIDRDRSNNVIENLMVLCPNCHAKVTKGIIAIEPRLGA